MLIGIFNCTCTAHKEAAFLSFFKYCLRRSKIKCISSNRRVISSSCVKESLNPDPAKFTGRNCAHAQSRLS